VSENGRPITNEKEAQTLKCAQDVLMTYWRVKDETKGRNWKDVLFINGVVQLT
jgi:hypothetical protein